MDTWAVEWMREGVVAAAAELLGLGQQSLVAALDGRSAEDKLDTAVAGRLPPSRQAVLSDHAMRCYCLHSPDHQAVLEWKSVVQP